MGKIYLHRGDTEQIKIAFYKGWGEYTPTDLENGDIFTLTLRDKKTKDVILQKQAIYPNTLFNIEHNDTKDLELKRYNYDIEYRKPDYSIVKTLILDDFEIGLDVTYGDS